MAWAGQVGGWGGDGWRADMATPPFKYAILQQQGPDRVNAYLLRNKSPTQRRTSCMMHDQLLTSCTHLAVCHDAAGRSPPATARRQNLPPAMLRPCVILQRDASTEGARGGHGTPCSPMFRPSVYFSSTLASRHSEGEEVQLHSFYPQHAPWR